MPFVWASGESLDEFEAGVRRNPRVKEFVMLDRIGDDGLYRIEWNESPTDLIEGIAASDAAVLQAEGNGKWLFRLRFPDHSNLTTFHNYLLDHGIAAHIERTYTLTEETETGHLFGLSDEQREALIMALQRGYFSTQSEVSLAALATELGISRQAVSSRIRRGNEKILRRVLLSSSAGRGR